MKILLLFIPFLILPHQFVEISTGTNNSINKEKQISNTINFQTEVVFKETDDVIFGRVSTSTVTSDGRVFMADDDQKMIHVFDPNGNYADSFGRQGSGPGEFQAIRKIIADHNHIHVFDSNQRMVHQFDQNNLRYVRSVSLMGEASQPQIRDGATMSSGSTFPSNVYLLSDGNYLVTLQDFRNPDLLQTVVLTQDGKTVEENRFEFLSEDAKPSGGMTGGSQSIFNTTFTRSTILALSGSGLLFSNWNENLKFTVFNESGNQLHSFSHPYKNTALNKQEETERLKNLQATGGRGGTGMMERILQNLEIPDTWPAVDKIYADKQNRLWVATFTDNRLERKWFLFDERGNLLAEFIWPSTKNIVFVEENTLFVQTVDEDEMAQVIRFRFELN